MEVIQGFKKRDASRPVIVALTTDGQELSTAGYDRVLQALGGSNAMFNVISLGSPAPATDDQARSRDHRRESGPGASPAASTTDCSPAWPSRTSFRRLPTC